MQPSDQRKWHTDDRDAPYSRNPPPGTGGGTGNAFAFPPLPLVKMPDLPGSPRPELTLLVAGCRGGKSHFHMIYPAESNLPDPKVNRPFSASCSTPARYPKPPPRSSSSLSPALSRDAAATPRPLEPPPSTSTSTAPSLSPSLWSTLRPRTSRTTRMQNGWSPRLCAS